MAAKAARYSQGTRVLPFTTCEIGRMEINYTFYFFAFFGKSD